MYFSYGLPKALITGCAEDEELVHLALHNDYLLLVSSASVQVWSGGQHHIKLGECKRGAENIEEEGSNIKAHWCPSRRLLAVAVSALTIVFIVRGS